MLFERSTSRVSTLPQPHLRRRVALARFWSLIIAELTSSVEMAEDSCRIAELYDEAGSRTKDGEVGEITGRGVLL